MANFGQFGAGGGATKAEVNIMNSTRVLSGGLPKVHTRAIASISGDGGVPNTVTVTVTGVHNLTTGAKVIVSGTVGFDETAQQTTTVTGVSTLTYQTTTHTAAGPEVVGDMSANSLFEVEAGVAEFVDHATSIESPPTSRVAFGPFYSQTITGILAQPFSDVAINAAGALVQQFNFSSSNIRDTPVLGRIVHPNRVTVQQVNPDQIQPDPVATALSLADLAKFLGNGNDSGNLYSPNGINLSMDKTDGRVFVLGGNRHNDISDPNLVATTLASPLAIEFNAVWRASTAAPAPVASSDGPVTVVTAGVYDDGTGPSSPAATPNGTLLSNEWVIHRIYTTTDGSTLLQYGQVVHSTLVGAKAAIDTEGFVRPSGFRPQLVRCYLIMRGAASDLSDIADAEFVEAPRTLG